jgi:uncharacterized integral membrane protein
MRPGYATPGPEVDKEKAAAYHEAVQNHYKETAQRVGNARSANLAGLHPKQCDHERLFMMYQMGGWTWVWAVVGILVVILLVVIIGKLSKK